MLQRIAKIPRRRSKGQGNGKNSSLDQTNFFYLDNKKIYINSTLRF